ncbi:MULTISPECIES: antirestriction protein ArdA [Enterococcus]|uniref:antirestriction protein ArdA n=1 Tax=Enterococcus TaxID=1350 RepID=UPI0023EF1F8A|nr:antirestriction protein ArdA [Enterococcus malodoratus]
MSVYVTNVSQFEDDGLLIGSWFTLPVSIEEVRETLQLDDDESYEIEDWEASFTLD